MKLVGLFCFLCISFAFQQNLQGEEEGYEKLLEAAILAQQRGEADEKLISCYYRAYCALPGRPEAIYYLSQIYNGQKQFALAYSCIKGWQASSQPEYRGWMENWGIPMQLSLAAYHLGKKEEFLALCDQLLKRNDLPENLRKQVLINKGFVVSSPSIDHEDPEDIYARAKYYHEKGLYPLAYALSKRAAQLVAATQDYKYLWQFSLEAYMVGNYEEALRAAEEIMQLKNLSASTVATLKKNLRWYLWGVNTFAHAKKHWGLPPWQNESFEPSPPPQFAPPAAEKCHLHLCTMASDDTPTLEQLKLSCACNGHSLEILGLNDKPFSFGKRLRVYKKYIDALPDEAVVMCIDGYDVLVLADEKTILTRFFSLDVPVLYSAEAYCLPFRQLADYLPKPSAKFSYLCAGSFIGYAGYLKKIFSSFDELVDEIDDQGLMILYSIYHKDSIYLDHDAKIFLTLVDVERKDLEMDREGKKITYLPFNLSPCVIHGNSWGKGLYQQIYDDLFK